MRTRAQILTVIVVTLSCLFTFARAEPLNDVNLKFSMTVPDGFVRDAELARAQPDFIHAFRKDEPEDVGVIIIIERMRGTLGRERLDASNRPPGFVGRVLTARWRDFDVDAFEVPEESNGIKIINYNVQVPLKPEAIQIRVIGRSERKDELLQLTNNLLKNLNGDSNWLRSVAPPALANSPSYGWLKLAIGVVGLITGLLVLWKIRRVSRRGTVLCLAVLIYSFSWAIAPGETSEMRLTVGVVRMLGFLGFLLGLFDLFRHPTARRSSEEPSAAMK